MLGSITDCDVTLLDIPPNALYQAIERAAEDQISEQVRAVAGSGTVLPFENACFDRLSHSDVLCCLSEKLEMLQECRRVATAGARMHFSVILPAQNLSPSEYQEALDVGPPFVDAQNGYELLLHESGWHILYNIDVSTEYQQTLQKFADSLMSNTPELQEAFGNEFASQRQRREEQVALIERGILQRKVFVTSAN